MHSSKSSDTVFTPNDSHQPLSKSLHFYLKCSSEPRQVARSPGQVPRLSPRTASNGARTD
jgi:hypothetical protein